MAMTPVQSHLVRWLREGSLLAPRPGRCAMTARRTHIERRWIILNATISKGKIPWRARSIVAERAVASLASTSDSVRSLEVWRFGVGWTLAGLAMQPSSEWAGRLAGGLRKLPGSHPWQIQKPPGRLASVEFESNSRTCTFTFAYLYGLG